MRIHNVEECAMGIAGQIAYIMMIPHEFIVSFGDSLEVDHAGFSGLRVHDDLSLL